MDLWGTENKYLINEHVAREGNSAVNQLAGRHDLVDTC